MKNIVLFILLLLSAQFVQAQISVESNDKNLNQLKKTLITPSESLNFSNQIQSYTQKVEIENNFSMLKNDHKQMPSVYAFKDLAFFCKIEVHLEKAVKMPVKFRLGSVDDNDYLEGKREKY